MLLRLTFLLLVEPLAALAASPPQDFRLAFQRQFATPDHDRGEPTPEEHLVLLQMHSVLNLAHEAKPLSNTSPEATEILHANTPRFINVFTLSLVAVIACITLLGFCMDRNHWAAAMVAASYAVLVPGLVSKDFSMNIAFLVREYAQTLPIVQTIDPFGILVRQLPERIGLTMQGDAEGPIHQSTRSFVPFLWRTGSRSGAIMIAIFAFVVPMVKLILLGLGEWWRHHPEAWRVRTARYCILAVQLISKWASPDMFAFTLLYYLVRRLHHPPLIESLQVFDVGFSCYNVFCVSSVLSTLLVQLPPLPTKAARTPWLSGTSLAVLACTLAVAWAVLFICGLLQPSLSVHLDFSVILKRSSLPNELLPLLESLHIEELVNSQVSLWHCVTRLWGWFLESHEVTLLLGAVMLSIFVIVFSVLDMVLLVVASLCGTVKGATGLARRALQMAHIVKHLAMLDVCVTGVIVISFAAAIYQKNGINVGVLPGAYVLVAAEAVHYATYYTVTTTAEALDDQEGH